MILNPDEFFKLNKKKSNRKDNIYLIFERMKENFQYE